MAPMVSITLLYILLSCVLKIDNNAQTQTNLWFYSRSLVHLISSPVTNTIFQSKSESEEFSKQD